MFELLMFVMGDEDYGAGLFGINMHYIPFVLLIKHISRHYYLVQISYLLVI